VSDGPTLPGGLRAAHATRLSGGDIATTWRATLDDGREVVVKHPSYDARVEAEGLDALRAAGAPVPAVIAVDEQALVLEHVGGPPDWARLGEQLAGLHLRPVDGYGWHRDNVIGALPQPNGWLDDWPRFYAERRLLPHLDHPALPRDVARRIEAACAGPLPDLLEHGQQPALVHGDLWSGNVVAGRWLIDPAVHHADREFELAFMDTFGGFPADLWDSYLAAAPLDTGWERRRPALQLYHLLVHVGLFGTGYVPAVVDRLERLGW
jgi:fructosamine-3-kinase